MAWVGVLLHEYKDSESQCAHNRAYSFQVFDQVEYVFYIITWAYKCVDDSIFWTTSALKRISRWFKSCMHSLFPVLHEITWSVENGRLKRVDMAGTQVTKLLTVQPCRIKSGLLCKNVLKSLFSPSTCFKCMPRAYRTSVGDFSRPEQTPNLIAVWGLQMLEIMEMEMVNVAGMIRLGRQLAAIT
jgi:hypothetical protein